MKKITALTFSTVLSFAFLNGQLQAFDTFANYAAKVPAIGLISDSIKFDGITISNFQFENEHKLTVVNPGQSFSATMHYEIDASELETLNRHHLIIGLDDDGPQQCILECYGIKDSEGDVCVTLKAPKKEGAYTVRFCHSTDLTEKQAKKAWWRGDGPSAQTIVGIVIVK